MDCKICGKILSTSHTLKNHMLIHTNERSFKCSKSDCSSSFFAFCDLNRHYREVHSKLNHLEFPCDVSGCQHISKSKQRRDIHVKESHPDFPAFKCSLCPFQTTKTLYLTQHIKILHLKEREFSCSHDNCNYSATTSSNLGKHLRTHLKEEDRRFSCPHSDSGCTKKFNQMATLRVHARVHTQERNYACSLCSYRGGSSGNLKVHMTTHTKEKGLQCKLCDYSTSIYGNLNVHIRLIHLKEKLFWCEEPNCESNFGSKGALQMHQTIHSGEKNYKCAECQMSFSVASNLLRHLRTIHRAEGEKPRRKCEFPGCSYRCDANSSMQSHVQSRHSNQRPFSCQLCEYRCKLKRNLTIHLNQSHAKNKKWKRKPKEQRYGYSIQKCTSCKFSTKDNAKLALHFSTAHQLPKIRLSKIDKL